MAIDFRTSIMGDHAIFDALEVVTVTQPGSTMPFTVVDARRTNRIREYDDIGGGVVVGTVVTFYLWADVCPQRPLMSARIVDANNVAYRVVNATSDTTIRTRYDVDCLQEV